jgi:hypothetical protein
MKIGAMIIVLFVCVSYTQHHIFGINSIKVSYAGNNKGCKFDNSAYFEEGDATIILNFEAKILKDAMDEYPTMIIEFSLCQLPSEKNELGEQRVQLFRELLEKEKFDFTRIQFSCEILYFTADQLLKSQLKPGIFGIVKSM